METTTEHALKARIIAVSASGKKIRFGERVANHGIVTCSCGWTSGEQVSLPEAARIQEAQHPEGVKIPGVY